MRDACSDVSESAPLPIMLRLKASKLAAQSSRLEACSLEARRLSTISRVLCATTPAVTFPSPVHTHSHSHTHTFHFTHRHDSAD